MSSTFFDSSSFANVVTSSGVTIDMSTPMFGTGAADFTSSSLDFLSCPVTPNGPLDLNSDFTVEGWVQYKSTAFGGALLSDTPVTTPKWAITSTSNVLQFLYQTSLGQFSVSSPTQALITNMWYSFAAVMRAGVMTMYLNGVGGSPTTINGALVATSGLLKIGCPSFTFAPNMELDEVRISTIARYASNYTPPPVPFVPDGNTSLLLHMDVLTFVNLGVKFVSPKVFKAIMVANPGTINPRIYPPLEDNTVRVKP